MSDFMKQLRVEAAAREWRWFPAAVPASVASQLCDVCLRVVTIAYLKGHKHVCESCRPDVEKMATQLLAAKAPPLETTIRDDFGGLT